MSARQIDIATHDGVMPCHFFAAPRGGTRPGVIVYMDAIGIRPALCGMAERFAAAGYHVLLPNLYYRGGATEVFEGSTAFAPGPQRDRIMALYRSLSIRLVMEDTADMLEFLAREPGVGGKTGCVGYCMGGGFALAAAGTFPQRIAAAASLHGARLATDQPNSPHLLAPQMHAGVYVGIAGIDPHFTPEEKQRLASALQAAGVRHALETYPEVKHGFAVTDTPAYDREASERHFERVLALFAEDLR